MGLLQKQAEVPAVVRMMVLWAPRGIRLPALPCLCLQPLCAPSWLPPKRDRSLDPTRMVRSPSIPRVPSPARRGLSGWECGCCGAWLVGSGQGPLQAAKVEPRLPAGVCLSAGFWGPWKAPPGILQGTRLARKVAMKGKVYQGKCLVSV